MLVLACYYMASTFWQVMCSYSTIEKHLEIKLTVLLDKQSSFFCNQYFKFTKCKMWIINLIILCFQNIKSLIPMRVPLNLL